MSALRRWPWYVVPLGIFAGTRVIAAGLLLILAGDQIPASQLPPDLPLPTLVDPASYWHVIANWDGQWYRLIAEHGYVSHLPIIHGVVQQSSWAFYPLFPGLLRLVMVSGCSFGVAASVVSLACGAAAMCLLYRLVASRASRFTAALSVMALCSAPAAPVFQAAYTESLALMLLLAALWCLEQRRYGALVAVAVLLSLSRPIVLPLALVAATVWIVRWKGRADDAFPVRERWRLGGAAVSVAGSFLIWPVVTALVTGRIDAYRETQIAWATVAGNSGFPWLAALVGKGHMAQASVVFLALGGLALVVARHAARAWPLTLRVWPVAYLLFIFAATPPTASIFRFLLLAVVPWWPVPDLSDRVRSTAARGALMSTVVVVGGLLQFLWLRAYFVIDPASLGNP